MGVEKELELFRYLGLGKVDVLEAEELSLHLGKLLLGRIDLSEHQRHLFGDYGDVVKGMVVEGFWG